MAALLGSAAGCTERPVPQGQVRDVVARLGAPSDRTRAKAERRLMKTHPTHTWGTLVFLFDDPAKSSPHARQAAIRIFLNTLGDGRKLPPAVKLALFRDPDTGVRREALAALVTRGNPAFVEDLERAAEREEDPALREEIRESFPRYRERRRAWLREWMRTAPDKNDRALAVRSLGSFGTPEDVPALVETFQEQPDTLIRYEIVLTAARLGGPEATELILSQLSSKDGYVRAAAAFAALELKEPRSIEPLARLLREDEVGDIRVSAARALAVIGGPEARAAVEAGCKDPPSNPVRIECGKAMDTLAGTEADL